MVAESFQSAKEKMIQYANTLTRPFAVRYNAITQSVEILDAPGKLLRLVKDTQVYKMCGCVVVVVAFVFVVVFVSVFVFVVVVVV